MVQRVRLERFAGRFPGQPVDVGARHRGRAGGLDGARRGVRPGNWPWAGVFNIWFLRRPFADIDPSKSEYYFRMIDPDFTPRKVYKAVAEAANKR